jgi:hypothetical protein
LSEIQNEEILYQTNLIKIQEIKLNEPKSLLKSMLEKNALEKGNAKSQSKILIDPILFVEIQAIEESQQEENKNTDDVVYRCQMVTIYLDSISRNKMSRL